MPFEIVILVSVVVLVALFKIVGIISQGHNTHKTAEVYSNLLESLNLIKVVPYEKVVAISNECSQANSPIRDTELFLDFTLNHLAANCDNNTNCLENRVLEITGGFYG